MLITRKKIAIICICICIICICICIICILPAIIDYLYTPKISVKMTKEKNDSDPHSNERKVKHHSENFSSMDSVRSQDKIQVNEKKDDNEEWKAITTFHSKNPFYPKTTEQPDDSNFETNTIEFNASKEKRTQGKQVSSSEEPGATQQIGNYSDLDSTQSQDKIPGNEEKDDSKKRKRIYTSKSKNSIDPKGTESPGRSNLETNITGFNASEEKGIQSEKVSSSEEPGATQQFGNYLDPDSTHGQEKIQGNEEKDDSKELKTIYRFPSRNRFDSKGTKSPDQSNFETNMARFNASEENRSQSKNHSTSKEPGATQYFGNFSDLDSTHSQDKIQGNEEKDDKKELKVIPTVQSENPFDPKETEPRDKSNFDTNVSVFNASQEKRTQRKKDSSSEKPDATQRFGNYSDLDSTQSQDKVPGNEEKDDSKKRERIYTLRSENSIDPKGTESPGRSNFETIITGFNASEEKGIQSKKVSSSEEPGATQQVGNYSDLDSTQSQDKIPGNEEKDDSKKRKRIYTSKSKNSIDPKGTESPGRSNLETNITGFNASEEKGIQSEKVSSSEEPGATQQFGNYLDPDSTHGQEKIQGNEEKDDSKELKTIYRFPSRNRFDSKGTKSPDQSNFETNMARFNASEENRSQSKNHSTSKEPGATQYFGNFPDLDSTHSQDKIQGNEEKDDKKELKVIPTVQSENPFDPKETEPRDKSNFDTNVPVFNASQEKRTQRKKDSSSEKPDATQRFGNNSDLDSTQSQDKVPGNEEKDDSKKRERIYTLKSKNSIDQKGTESQGRSNLQTNNTGFNASEEKGIQSKKVSSSEEPGATQQFGNYSDLDGTHSQEKIQGNEEKDSKELKIIPTFQFREMLRKMMGLKPLGRSIFETNIKEFNASEEKRNQAKKVKNLP